jgi:GGDEF domain-containing protein
MTACLKPRSRKRTARRVFAVLFVDLDRFKTSTTASATAVGDQNC